MNNIVQIVVMDMIQTKVLYYTCTLCAIHSNGQQGGRAAAASAGKRERVRAHSVRVPAARV